MRHDLTLAGPAFRLRPVSDADAALILQLRSDPQLNRYLHPTSPDLADQLAWLACYYERPGDYYFVIERQRTQNIEGLISIYNIDCGLKKGIWGRWIIKAGSFAAVESVWLIYKCGFELLGLNQVCPQTIVDNLSVVSFHDSCGIGEKRILKDHFQIKDQYFDAVEHQVDCIVWAEINQKLKTLAQHIARRL